MSKLSSFVGFGFSTLLAIALFAGFQNTPAQKRQDTESVPAALQCAQFGLRNAEYFRIPSVAGSLATADFNNDALPDVVAMMSGTNSISVSLGDNQTGFTTARDFVVGVSPQEAVVGDFNRDGELDLAVTTSLDDLVTVLHGDGLGNFEVEDSYPVGGAPRGLQTTDFNRDGWLDLVVVNTEAPNVGLSILLGGPNGMTPANPGTIALIDYPKAVETADFNNDGNPDIVTVAHTFASGPGSPSTVRIFQGNGSGGFTEALTFPLGESYAVETADFNSDGFADFAVYGQPDVKVQVYLNNQSGGFNAPLEFPIPGATASGLQGKLIAGDLNSDGIVDLAFGSFFMLNNGSANFTIRPRGEVLQGNFVLADFNGDGMVDQASPGDIGDNSSPQYSTFAVAYGTGDARFVVPSFFEGVGGTTDTLTGDFNNDGRDDVVFGNGGFSFNQMQIAFQNADASFNTQRIPIHSGTANNYTIVVKGDFNNDGKPDLATNITWARQIVILTNNGSGQFTNSGVTLNSQNFAFQLEHFQPGDFNNDGYMDFITVNQTSYILVLNNGAAGGYTVQPFVTIGSSFEGTKRIAVGDFNTDGNLDFVVARTNALYEFRGNGSGTFVQANLYQLPLPFSMARSADLNNDNRPDVVVTTGGNFTIGGAGTSVFIAGATGTFTQTNFTVEGGPGDILFGDLNNDTFKDFVVLNAPNNHLTVFNGNGVGGFTPQTPFIVSPNPTSGAFGNLNQDQKPDIVLGGRFSGVTRLFYNATPLSPCLSVNNPTVAEGNTGTVNAQFTISLSEPSAETVSVDYRLVARSATLNSDFSNQTGTLTFAAGTLTQTVNVPVIGDVKDEIDETFQLVLSNPSGASLPRTTAIGTMLDDDAAPTVSIGDVSMLEGTGTAQTQMVFNLALSAPTGRKAKVNYSLLNGTAQGGSDFAPHGGTAVFNADQSTQQIIVNVTADAYVEPDESFRVKLSAPSNLSIADDEANATIINDDFGGTVQFGSASYAASEADDAVTITVSRSGGAAAGVIVTYSTANGTATANSDYLSSAGKIIFDAGETSKTFTVPILDDAIDEAEMETVNLTLSNISGGAVLGAQSSAVLNISDDDPPTSVTLADISVNEGNGGTTTANFTVQLLAVSGLSVSVNFATANGTATEPTDYSGVSGTLAFAPGETVKTLSVVVNGDTQIEPNETFFLNLSAPVNAILQNAQATATIINDDLNARRPADFDGDGKTDISIFRPIAGAAEWWINRSGNGQTFALQFGSSTDRIAPADYTGDGKADVAFFRPSSGEWYVLRSEDFSFFALPFGTNGDVPVPADYDADGKADFAVFRTSSSTWFISQSSGAPTRIVQFGINGDQPVVSDYDGDGKADIGVFRQAAGGAEWWIDRSTAGSLAMQFGSNTDKVVQGDYTGDGKADIAIWRPATGEWFIVRSEDFSFYGFPFGTSGDVVAPGDYDGDGRFDATVFRPSTATWFISRTTAGTQIVQFGASTDLPIPGAFVP